MANFQLMRNQPLVYVGLVNFAADKCKIKIDLKLGGITSPFQMQVSVSGFDGL